MTADDLPWAVALAVETHGSMIDPVGCEKYYRATLNRPDHAYFRGELSAAAARVFMPYWAPAGSKPLADDVFFCAKKAPRAAFELVGLMRAMVEWAAKSGCRQMSFTSYHGTDISVIAKRVGATMSVPCFRIIF